MFVYNIFGSCEGENTDIVLWYFLGFVKFKIRNKIDKIFVLVEYILVNR